MPVGTAGNRKRDALEWICRSCAEQCSRGALGGAGQEATLAKISAGIEVQDRLAAETPQPNDGCKQQDRHTHPDWEA